MPTLIANYLTVDPVTGAVGADFTGHVHAAGVDLDASPITSTPASGNLIRWLQQPGGALVAQVAGETDGTTNLGILRAPSPNGLSGAQLAVSATNAAQSVTATVDGVTDAVLVDQLGRASFVQLPALGRLGLDFLDTGVFSLNGGAALGANLAWGETFGHTLGRSPAYATAIYVGGGTLAGNLYCETLLARNTFNVQLRFRLVNGAVLAAASTGRFFVFFFG